MKRKLTGVVLSLALALPAFADETDTSAFKDKRDRESYAIGAQTARTLKKDHVDINAELLIQGFKDGLAGDKLLMSEKELRAVMSRVQSEVRNAMVADRRALGLRNREEGNKYLADNAKKEGVKTTESGLQYKVLKEGSGAKPNLGDTVALNYRGTLLDGTEFDASPPGKPVDLVVVQTVPGFKEALRMMGVGSHWQLVVPAGLGYGERGIGTQIGPYQTLQFDVELVAIKKIGPAAKSSEAAKP